MDMQNRNLEAEPVLDQARQEAFENRMVDALNAGALCLMTSVGHRTGLFDAMGDGAARTIDQLATDAGLNSRYVREWLGAMVSAQVVEHDHDGGTYRLPVEHAACLTRDATPNNLAVFTQYMPHLGTVEDDIVACFKNGGGVPYGRYGRFHEIMAEDSGQTVLPALRDHILPLVPDLTTRLEKGIRVLDAGCGRGRALIMMAEWFPNSTFVGYDLSADAVAHGRAQAEKRGLANVTFEQRDLTGFATEADAHSFDLVTTFDAVHDQADPSALLRGIRHSLAPGGVYLAQDIKGSGHHHHDREHPIGTLLYSLSCMHCMPVSLAQDGAGLGAMWGKETALRMFTEAGFDNVEVHELDHDIQNYYYVCRP
ncbi:class I SAM-dependent methyltransferase [Magnetospira sp. QH-2]|uniref:class I SAM-dependent methyltransferase n=1 Tax=Magnetospira sp. (strain QH-2) TaxID=1288970 RepID=UPI0003E81621|nr:class I SAM-dependent methyltransferase [Magnetospira sp. QH-2]CCQ74825.1 putative methyltransferase [Magnetospira sp. QH-2]